MPLYEYRCQSCGKKFEVLQKFSDEPLKTHEECGGPVEKLVSAPAFHLKGTGWYATDYAKSGATTPPGKSEDSKSGGEAKTDSSAPATDSKPAATESKAPAPAPATKE